MKNFSNKNTYATSYGTRLTRDQIERKVRKAKFEKITSQMHTYGYCFCEICRKNANAGEPLDCSHTISVKEALESGRAELAYDEII